MTPNLALNQKDSNVTRRRINRATPILERRRSAVSWYIKRHLGGGRVVTQSIEYAPTLRIVELTNSAICSAEFGSWTILDEDIGNNDFLQECMRLYGFWCWMLDGNGWEADVFYDTVSEEDTVTEEATVPDCGSWAEDDVCCVCDCEEGMEMHHYTMEEDEEEAIVEPETHDSLLMAALLSTKDLLPAPSGGAIRALSCPDLLISSLATLLFETRHLHYINERLAVPAPPKWMTALEAIREMDPPNSLVSTVSLPSGWDAVSARLSSSSIFNVFFDRPVTGIELTASTVSLSCFIAQEASSSTSSLFAHPSMFGGKTSTVSIPQSFWDTPSTVSVSTVESSMGPLLFAPLDAPSISSINASTVSTTSSLFIDPSSAHSDSSISSPSGCSSHSSSSLVSQPTTATTCASFCSYCQCYHFDEEDELVTSSSDSSTSECEITHEAVNSDDTYTVSSASSGYETDVDSEPVVLKKITTTTSTQTEALYQSLYQIDLARMLAECDEMVEKLVEMKKKLMELM